MAEHGSEAVAPLELSGQVGLASHEVVARLCSTFKGDDDLGIRLRADHNSGLVCIDGSLAGTYF